MAVSMDLVKNLRESSGAGIMACRDALAKAESEGLNGDAQFKRASAILEEEGAIKLEKRKDRVTAEGLIEAYVHNGRIGVLVEVNSETDFVARNPKFAELTRDIAMHIAAMSPQYLDRESVPSETIAQLREEFIAAVPPGKPADVATKIVEGKLNKWYEEHCLLDQPFVKDDSLSIADLINSVVGVLGEKIKVRRFTKYALGES